MTVERRFANIGHDHSHQVGASGDWWDKPTWVRADGVMEIGRYLDFHNADGDTSDYTFRIENDTTNLIFSGGVHVAGVVTSTGPSGALWFASRDATNNGFAWYSPDGITGYLWSAYGERNSLTFTSSGTLTATNLQATGYVSFDFLYAGGFGSANTANTFYSDGYGSVKFGVASTAATGYPILPDNANFVISYESHAGGYGRQFFYPDSQDMYTRLHQAGSWGTWHKLARHEGATYLVADSYDSWSTSAWVRALSLRPSTTSVALQFYNATRHWGIGVASGTFYIMHTTSDTSAAPGMTYPMYNDGTYWNIADSTIHAAHISIPSGFGYYLNGMFGSHYVAYPTAGYGSIRIGGTISGYCGIQFESTVTSTHLMFDSASGNGGFIEPGVKWFGYFHSSDNCWGYGSTTTSASYRIYVTGSSYATGSWATSDARKKDRVKTIPSALDKVCAMRGVEYYWRADADVGQDPEQRHIGVIAQEIQAVVPEAVQYSADADVFAVDYNGLVGLLIQAVRELKEKYEQAN